MILRITLTVFLSAAVSATAFLFGTGCARVGAISPQTSLSQSAVSTATLTSLGK